MNIDIRIISPIIGVAALSALVVSTASAQSANAALTAAEGALGTRSLTSLRITGSGSSAMIGQGLAAGAPAKWVLASYAAEFNYAAPGLRMDWNDHCWTAACRSMERARCGC